MSPQRLDEILRDYRITKARVAYLKDQLRFLEKRLAEEMKKSIQDQISLSQAITGMPHGSGTGDPTGKLGTEIASGKESEFVKQIREEIRQASFEIMKLEPDISTAEIVLNALSDREREVLEMKIMAEMSWSDTLAEMNRKHNNSYSKRSLQRLLDRAKEKAYEVVR